MHFITTNMLRVYKSKWFRLVVIPSLFFFVFIFNYNFYIKTIPLTYFDEVLWIARSHFFDRFIRMDYKNKVWESLQSYDQPKLGEYLYGAWLYPRYIKEKITTGESIDYTEYLIKNGFYDIDESYLSTYSDYKSNFNYVTRDDMRHFPFGYINRSGEAGIKTINTIYYARVVNIFLLSLATIFAYFFAIDLLGLIPAVIFTFLYGFNTLIVNTGLKAHSEALFLFMFNAAFFCMVSYQIKGRKIVHLLLFALFTGLCISTKLNGLMLLVMFFVSSFLLNTFSGEKIFSVFTSTILALFICISIFVSLNPFTYTNTFNNIRYMFNSRMQSAIWQSDENKEFYLPQWGDRFEAVFNNFFKDKQIHYFNGIKILPAFQPTSTYGAFLAAVFGIGFIRLLILAFRRDKRSIIILSSFITIITLMSYYLVLDWDRYYAHLPFLFILIEILGLCYAFSIISELVKKIWIKIGSLDI